MTQPRMYFISHAEFLNGCFRRVLNVFICALGYAIRNFHGNRVEVEMELNGTHKFPAYSDDVNLLDENINVYKPQRIGRFIRP